MSGSSPLDKEDGKSERILAQLKSTNGRSVTLHFDDLQELRKNAAIAGGKKPLFILDFAHENVLLLCMLFKDHEAISEELLRLEIDDVAESEKNAQTMHRQASPDLDMLL